MQTNYVIVLQLCKRCQSMLRCWWYSKQNLVVTSSGLKTELQTYASLYTILVWIWLFFFFFPRQLCLSKLFSTYLSRKDVEIKRRENPAKHSSLVVCWGAIPRQKQPPYLRSTVSAEIDISITSYYKHSRLTTVPHLRGLRGNTQRGVCRECHLRFCFSPLVSPLLSWCWCHWEVSDWVMVSAEVAEVSLALIPVRQP